MHSWISPPSLSFFQVNEKFDHRDVSCTGSGELPVVRSANIRQFVLGHLGKVVAEEQTTSRMLNTFAHFHHIPEHILGRCLLRLNVDGTHSDQ